MAGKKKVPDTVQECIEQINKALKIRDTEKRRPCCEIMLNNCLAEGLQYTLIEYGIHNILINFCPQCGARLK